MKVSPYLVGVSLGVGFLLYWKYIAGPAANAAFAERSKLTSSTTKATTTPVVAVKRRI